jgi:hypothetical protein
MKALTIQITMTALTCQSNNSIPLRVQRLVSISLPSILHWCQLPLQFSGTQLIPRSLAQIYMATHVVFAASYWGTTSQLSGMNPSDESSRSMMNYLINWFDRLGYDDIEVRNREIVMEIVISILILYRHGVSLTLVEYQVMHSYVHRLVGHGYHRQDNWSEAVGKEAVYNNFTPSRQSLLYTDYHTHYLAVLLFMVAAQVRPPTLPSPTTS